MRSWSAREWLPNAATLTLIGVTTTPASVVVEGDGPAFARCPACDRPSQTRHSRYWRTLKDVAAQGRSVTLRVHVSRWRCGNAHCDTGLFADRVAGVSAPRVHHTQRFVAVAHLVGHALGRRGGERLLARLGMDISDDTILRLLKQPTVAPPVPVLHVVGIDGLGLAEGPAPLRDDSGGLGARRVVDVLSVRTADAVAAWPRQSARRS